MKNLASEKAALVGIIDPDAYVASTVTTGWISAKNYDSFMASVYAGDLGASATVDAKLEQATDASGTGVKDITSKSITQLTQAGTDSNKQVVVNLRHEQMDIKNDFDFFRLSITVAVATSDVGGAVYGLDPVYGPASANDLSTVDQIVV